MIVRTTLAAEAVVAMGVAVEEEEAEVSTAANGLEVQKTMKPMKGMAAGITMALILLTRYVITRIKNGAVCTRPCKMN
jgi:hypothetical protein